MLIIVMFQYCYDIIIFYHGPLIFSAYISLQEKFTEFLHASITEGTVCKYQPYIGTCGYNQIHISVTLVNLPGSSPE